MTGYPYPLMFGRRQKDFRFPHIQMKHIGQRQVFYSSTTYNLFVEPLASNNLSLGDLLAGHWTAEYHEGLEAWRPGQPDRVVLTGLEFDPADPEVWLEVTGCEACRTNSGMCRLFAHVEGDPPALCWNSGEELLSALSTCSRAAFLLAQCETKSEGRFLEQYLAAAVEHAGSDGRGHPDGFQEVTSRLLGRRLSLDEFKLRYIPRLYPAELALFHRLSHPIGARPVATLPLQQRLALLRVELLSQLRLPALIPQAYLNIVSSYRLPKGHPDAFFYRDNLCRVDFIALAGGRRHIVEIDGPSHFADESAYTRTVITRRDLEHSGWKVHCFTNQEVSSYTGGRYILEVLGFG